MKRLATHVLARVIFGLCFSFVLLLAGSLAHAGGTADNPRGFIKLESGRSLWVDFIRPKGNAPTVVLLNGLTYDLESWNPFVAALKDSGLGILRFDFMGQGKTLEKNGPVTYRLDYQNQTNDLRQLLDKMKLRRVHLVGLSYGGGIAMAFHIRFPQYAESLILMAPYTEPLKAQDDWIRLQVASTRIMFPWNPATDEQLYDYYLRMNVYQTFPMAEPVVMKHPWRLEAAFRLAQGIRKFKAVDVAQDLANAKIHLVVARGDQYINNKVHEVFWKAMPKSARADVTFIEESEHKIPEDVPKFSAAWVEKLVRGGGPIGSGTTFVGIPSQGVVKFPGGTIADLPREK